MLMRQSTHDAIVAAKDAEIVELRALVGKQSYDLADRAARHRATEIDACNLASECNRLRAKLSAFTAPWQRDAKGHFVSAKGVS